MRTYEDVQATLSRYKEELVAEEKVNSHFVVIGGNMCITRKGMGTNYVLGKGDPIPMVKHTAEKHLECNKDKVMGDMKLKIIPYAEWLRTNIEECQKLCNCMEQSLNDKPTNPEPAPAPESTPEPEPIQNDPIGIPFRPRSITLSCPTCPCGILNCMSCRFCKGVRTETYPWNIICEFITK